MDSPWFPFFALRVEKEGTYSLLNPANNAIYDLNYRAVRVLELCDGRHSVEEIAREAADGSPESDVESFVQEMSRERVMTWRRARAATPIETPPPSTVFWDVTYRCNLRCIHCYNSPRWRKEGELSTPEVARILEELEAAGVKDLAFGGGEPLLRKDFPEILRTAGGLGFRTLNVATNGTLVDREAARRLKEAECKVQVSVDGDRAEIHDEMRGMKGAFALAIRGLEILREEGVDVSVCSTVTRRTVDAIPAIRELMKRLGIARYRVQGVVPVGRGRDNWRDLALSADRMRGLAVSLEGTNVPVSGYNFTLREPQCGPVDYKGSAACSAATDSCSITSEGSVVPCSYFLSFNGDSLREHTFRWIWDNSVLLNYVRNITLEEIRGHCRDCGWLSECHGGCKIINFVNGDMLGSLNECWVDPRRRVEGSACK